MEPRRSPDGTRIAYAIDAPAQLRSVAVTPNPTPHVVAGFAARVGWPSWSSDGSWIAYEIWQPDQRVEIRKIHVDGMGDTLLLGHDGYQVTWGYRAATPIIPPHL